MTDAVRVPFLIDYLFQLKNFAGMYCSNHLLGMCSFTAYENKCQENENSTMQQMTIFIQREELEHLGFSFIGKITFLKEKI